MQKIGIAELDAQVTGAVSVLYVPGLIREQRGENLFGLGAVRGGALEVAGKRANLGARNVGDRHGLGVGQRLAGSGNQIDGLIGVEAGFRQVVGAFAIDDKQQDEVVEGSGADLELRGRQEALGGLNGLTANVQGIRGMVERGLLAAGVEGLEGAVDEEVRVGRKLLEREVDRGGDDRRAGAAVGDQRRVNGVRVGVDGGLAEQERSAERLDGGDVAGRVDVHLQGNVALDAGLASFVGVEHGRKSQGLVVDRGGGLCGGKNGAKREEKECKNLHGWECLQGRG